MSWFQEFAQGMKDGAGQAAGLAWDLAKKPYAWFLAASAWIYENSAALVDHLDTLATKLELGVSYVSALPNTAVFGYVNRVFPLSELMLLLGLWFAVALISILIRLFVEIMKMLVGLIP